MPKWYETQILLKFLPLIPEFQFKIKRLKSACEKILLKVSSEIDSFQDILVFAYKNGFADLEAFVIGHVIR